MALLGRLPGRDPFTSASSSSFCVYFGDVSEPCLQPPTLEEAAAMTSNSGAGWRLIEMPGGAMVPVLRFPNLVRFYRPPSLLEYGSDRQLVLDTDFPPVNTSSLDPYKMTRGNPAATKPMKPFNVSFVYEGASAILWYYPGVPVQDCIHGTKLQTRASRVGRGCAHKQGNCHS